MIRADHISKTFDGRTVLDDITVEFETGKTNLIIGRSGSGKTVLLKSLVGLHDVDSGKIFFDDQDTHLTTSSKYVPSGKVPYHSSSQIIEAIKEKKEAENG